jgi:hypothetical protein
MHTFLITLAVVCLFVPLGVAEGPKSVSAAEHGATGDGVTDDTAAIRAALAAVAPGGVVHLPAGDYVLTDSLEVPDGILLEGEGARWQSRAVRLLVKGEGFPAVRLRNGSGLKGMGISYPDNQNNAEPREYPPAVQLEGINPSVENVTFDCAWIGVSTAPGGANAGQAMLRDLSGHVHHVGVHLSGTMDVNRLQNIHWFVGGNTPEGTEAYYVKNRVGFRFGRVDGILMDQCFMILGKTFLHHMNETDTPEGPKSPNHSLGIQVSSCWIEHVDNGFIFEGYTGFGITNSNILINEGGTGIRVANESLFYNAVISGVQVRHVEGPVIGIDVDMHEPHPRNRLSIADVQIVGGAPAILLRPGATRVNIHDSHLQTLPGEPGVRIMEGADLLTITNNIFTGTVDIEDYSAPDARKQIHGNLFEESEEAAT